MYITYIHKNLPSYDLDWYLHYFLWERCKQQQNNNNMKLFGGGPLEKGKTYWINTTKTTNVHTRLSWPWSEQKQEKPKRFQHIKMTDPIEASPAPRLVHGVFFPIFFEFFWVFWARTAGGRSPPFKRWVKVRYFLGTSALVDLGTDIVHKRQRQ